MYIYIYTYHVYMFKSKQIIYIVIFIETKIYIMSINNNTKNIQNNTNYILKIKSFIY